MNATVRPLRERQPVAEVIDVTPEMAARWLSKNLKNRNLRHPTAAAYARDMAAGNWQFTGEAIKFDNRGNLIDGQHRLTAITQAGVTLSMLVIQGLEPEAQDVLDSGAKRNAADALNLSGISYATSVAAGARLGISIENSTPVTKTHATNSEIQDFVANHPDIIEAAAAITKVTKFIDLTPAVLTYTFMTLSRVDAAAAAEFFTSLANNSTGGTGDPRNTLIRRMASARRNAERVPAEAQIGFVYRAWNAWRKGEDLHVLRTRVAGGGDGGSVKVRVPQPA